MKKLIAILALALVLCLACGAVAEVKDITAIDFDNPTFLKSGLVHFQDPGDVNNWIEFKFNKDKPDYGAELNKLVPADVEAAFDILGENSVTCTNEDGTVYTVWVVGSGDCTKDSWVEIEARNVSPVLRTYNQEILDLGFANIAAANPKTDKGEGFFGLVSADRKVVSFAELKAANPAAAKKIAARKHDPDPMSYVIETEATCTEGGKIIPTCKNCSLTYEAITTDAKGHESGIDPADLTKFENPAQVKVGLKDGTGKYVVTKVGTCSAKGAYEGPCKVCGEKVSFELPKIADNHNYGAWQFEIDPTCEKDGLKYRLCKDCLKAKEYDNAAALGHDWVFDFSKVPTCVDVGEAKKITCTRCKVVVKADAGAFVITGSSDPAALEADLIAEGYAANGNKIETPIDENNHPKEFWQKDDTHADYKEATCQKAGVDVFVCLACGNVANKATVPATGHKLVTYYAKVADMADHSLWMKEAEFVGACAIDPITGKPFEFKTVTICENCAYPHDRKECKYPSVGDAEHAADDWTAVAPVDHDWGAWIVRNEPSDTTPGYWIRECKVCHIHDEFIGNKAPTNATDPTQPTKNGLQLEEDGTVQLYVDGKPSTASGVYAYNGGRFAVVNGKVDTSINGAVVTSATECLFFANGQVQESYTGLAEYNGQWFVVKAGKVDTAFNGLFAHDGGTFVVAAGRVVKELNGLWLAPDGEWYLISNGQVYWADAEVEYDGATFTVKGGKVVA